MYIHVYEHAKYKRGIHRGAADVALHLRKLAAGGTGGHAAIQPRAPPAADRNHPIHDPDGTRAGGRNHTGKAGQSVGAGFDDFDAHAGTVEKSRLDSGERGRGPAISHHPTDKRWAGEVAAFSAALEAGSEPSAERAG